MASLGWDLGSEGGSLLAWQAWVRTWVVREGVSWHGKPGLGLV